MTKELMLLEKGKTVVPDDYIKIEAAMKKEKAAFPYIMHDLFLLCKNKHNFESSISLLLENVFQNMKRERIIQIAGQVCINEPPVLIKTILGQTIFFFEDKEEKGFVVTCPSLTGCFTQGDTEEEATKNVREAIKGYLNCVKKHGIDVSL